MVEFVSYDGSYPNLCTGKTILKINGETVILPPYSLTSGGYFLVDEDRTESVCKGLWSVDLPEELEQYRREIEDCINDNVPHGCCGGCI